MTTQVGVIHLSRDASSADEEEQERRGGTGYPAESNPVNGNNYYNYHNYRNGKENKNARGRRMNEMRESGEATTTHVDRTYLADPAQEQNLIFLDLYPATLFPTLYRRFSNPEYRRFNAVYETLLIRSFSSFSMGRAACRSVKPRESEVFRALGWVTRLAEA